MTDAARVWFLLQYQGIRRVWVLNGGFVEIKAMLDSGRIRSADGRGAPARQGRRRVSPVVTGADSCPVGLADKNAARTAIRADGYNHSRCAYGGRVSGNRPGEEPTPRPPSPRSERPAHPVVCAKRRAAGNPVRHQAQGASQICAGAAQIVRESPASRRIDGLSFTARAEVVQPWRRWPCSTPATVMYPTTTPASVSGRPTRVFPSSVRGRQQLQPPCPQPRDVDVQLANSKEPLVHWPPRNLREIPTVQRHGHREVTPTSSSS